MNMGVRRIAIATALFVCALSVSACDPNAMINWFVPQAQTHEAEAYFAEIQAGNFTDIRKNFDPQYLNDGLEPALAKIADFFPGEHTSKVFTSRR